MTAGVGQHPGRGSGRGGSTRGCHVGGVFDDRPRSARCRAWRRRAGRAWFRGPRRARAGLAGSLIASLLGCAAGDSSAPGFDAPRLALEAELRIGSVDDPELAFTWFRGLVVGPDGRIYTAHPQENAIRVHDAEGRPVGRIGRAGEGPGEFRSLGPIGILGDTLLWALDYGTYRFSFFDLDGTLVRSLNVPTRMGATLEERPPRASGLFSDGSIMASPPAWDNLVADGTISQDSILRMDSTGAVLELVTTIPLHNTTLAVTDPRDPRGFGAYFPQPYSDTELVKISPFDSSIVRVDRRAAEDARVGAFRVTRLHFRGDTIFSREYRYSPIPLDPARPDSIVREYTERVGRVPSPPRRPWPRRSASSGNGSTRLASSRRSPGWWWAGTARSGCGARNVGKATSTGSSSRRMENRSAWPRPRPASTAWQPTAARSGGWSWTPWTCRTS